MPAGKTRNKKNAPALLTFLLTIRLNNEGPVKPIAILFHVNKPRFHSSQFAPLAQIVL
jgi:hypothetical protein